MSRKNLILIIVLVVIAAVGAVVWYGWFKPKRDVSNEEGIVVTAVQLVKEFQANEATANAKYLDKAIQVTGTVTEVKNNQDGKATIMLSSDDAFTGVFCTMKESAGTIAPGSAVTLKGICSGMLT